MALALEWKWRMRRVGWSTSLDRLLSIEALFKKNSDSFVEIRKETSGGTEKLADASSSPFPVIFFIFPKKWI